MKNLMFALLLAMAVACIGAIACSPVGTNPDAKPLTEHQQIEQVCVGVSASYAAAGVLNDRSPFSLKQQNALTRTAVATDKVCTNIPNSWLEVAPEFGKAVGDATILSKGGTPL